MIFLKALGSLVQGLDANVSESDGSVIALQEDGAGLIQIRIDFASRRLRNLNVIVDFDTV